MWNSTDPPHQQQHPHQVEVWGANKAHFFTHHLIVKKFCAKSGYDKKPAGVRNDPSPSNRNKVLNNKLSA